MKKFFPIALMIFGLAFVAGGGYTIYRGFDARSQVKSELVAQNIVTPDDASIPGVRVDSAATAKSMAEIIEQHSLESSDGLTYAQLGRFMAADGSVAGTSVEEEALIGDDGRPVPNALRNSAFQASALRTSLYTSVMAFEVATLVVGLGLMLVVLGISVGGLGVALGALAIPALARRLQVPAVAAVPAPATA